MPYFISYVLHAPTIKKARIMVVVVVVLNLHSHFLTIEFAQGPWRDHRAERTTRPKWGFQIFIIKIDLFYETIVTSECKNERMREWTLVLTARPEFTDFIVAEILSLAEQETRW